MSTPVITPAARAAAKPPLAAPAATGVAVVLALALIALGIVAARDALIAIGAISGSAWIAAALNFLDGLTAQTWMLPAGLATAVLGISVVFVAVKPRRRTHLALRVPDTWIRRRDIVQLARSAARAITGVSTVTAAGSARTITLAVTPLAGYDTTALKDTVRTAVDDALTELARPPRVRVRVKEQGPS